MKTKSTTLFFHICMGISSALLGQNNGDIFSDDYTTGRGWTHINTGVSVEQGHVYASNATANLTPRRVYKSLNKIINPIDNWVVDLEFMDRSTSGMMPSYDLFVLSPNYADPRVICSSPSSGCTSNFHTDKNVFINYGIVSNPKDTILYMGITNGPNTKSFLVSSFKQYYLRLTKQGNTFVFSAFSDAERTNHIKGSPETLYYSEELPTYSYIQHAVSTAGGNFRSSSFIVDNTYIGSLQDIITNNNDNSTQETAFQIIPNPASDKLTVKHLDSAVEEISIFNTTGQQVLVANNVLEVDIRTLQKGTYIVRARNKNDVYTEKLVID